MDIVYLYKQTADDFEIRYSLRSVAKYAPYVRKVWIFGDRPSFIPADRVAIEHVPHEGCDVLGLKMPVTNFFLLMFLSSLIPDLSFEYLRFSDDFYLMKNYPIEEARKDRYVEDLSRLPHRKGGVWGDSLWRTHDLLRRLGYSGYNFEIHAPTYFTRSRVFNAYRDLQDFVTEDRWQGMMAATAILNHTHTHKGLRLVSILEEDSRFGYWDAPPSYEEIVAASEGKTFFNVGEPAFGASVRKFLEGRFPEPSRYEKPRSTAYGTGLLTRSTPA